MDYFSLDSSLKDYKNLLPELLDRVLNDLDTEKFIREVACSICSILLDELKKAYPSQQIHFCLLFGYFDWLRILKLKGAAGIQPKGFLYREIPEGKGFIASVAKHREPRITSDLSQEKELNDIDQYFASLSKRVSLAVYPMILKNKELAGLLVLGQYLASHDSPLLFYLPSFSVPFTELCHHISNIYYHSLKVVKSNLAKQYIDNERHFLEQAKLIHKKDSPSH